MDLGADVCATGHIYRITHLKTLSGQPIIHAGQSWNGGVGARDDIFPLFIAAERQAASIL